MTTPGAAAQTSFDPEQISTAQQVLRAAVGQPPKVQLALMEAGLVESGMRNLNHGDRDSLGVFQERPSQGWTNPMDVANATRQLIAHMNMSLTDPGQLAQSAEHSGFPDRYGKMQSQAMALLAQAQGGMTDGGIGGGNVLTDAHTSGVGGFTEWVSTGATRVGLVIFGGIILVVGVWIAVGHHPKDFIKSGQPAPKPRYEQQAQQAQEGGDENG